MLKALLVDMDGTLVNSARANAGAYGAALLEVGITVDPVQLAPEIDGRSWRDFLPGLVAGMPGVSAEAVARRKRALYPDYFHLLRLNQNLVDLIRLVHGRLATGLVTTASGVAVAGITRHFNLHGLFDVVVSGDNVANAKPAPDGYVIAAEMLHICAAECLVIEDSEVGMEAAQAFGGGLLRWTEPLNQVLA